MTEVSGFVNDHFEIRSSRRDMILIRACLLEAWEALDDSEFAARTGFEAAEAVELRILLTKQGALVLDGYQ